MVIHFHSKYAAGDLLPQNTGEVLIRKELAAVIGVFQNTRDNSGHWRDSSGAQSKYSQLWDPILNPFPPCQRRNSVCYPPRRQCAQEKENSVYQDTLRMTNPKVPSWALVLPSGLLWFEANQLTLRLLSHLYIGCSGYLFPKAISNQKNATTLPQVITKTIDTEDFCSESYLIPFSSLLLILLLGGEKQRLPSIKGGSHETANWFWI